MNSNTRLMLSLLAALVVASCDDQGSGTTSSTGKASAASPPTKTAAEGTATAATEERAPAPAQASGPSQEEVAALDCDKACKKQDECNQANGIKVTPDMAKACLDGCNTMKAAYNPAMHGKTAALQLKRAPGTCE